MASNEDRNGSSKILVETSKTSLKINREKERKTTNKGHPRITSTPGVGLEGYVHEVGCTQSGKIQVGLEADVKAFPKATYKFISQ